jgi:hypothetical protein
MRLLAGLTLVLVVIGHAAAEPASPQIGQSVTSGSSHRFGPEAPQARRRVATGHRLALAVATVETPRAQPGPRGLLDAAVRALGAMPSPAPVHGADISPLAPPSMSVPSHLEWLANVTPPALRSTAPYWPLRPRVGI